MTKGTVISLVVVVVAVAAWFIFRNAKESIAPILTPTPTPTLASTASPAPTQQANTVIYTDSGYSPATLTIKKGQTVVWNNESSKKMWTASAIHPTHSIYPTTGGCLGSTFDACTGIASGGTWSFKFDI